MIKFLEDAKPFFEKITTNNYIAAIRDGFTAAMYVILFSSIFILIAYIPNIWGFYWQPEMLTNILAPYDFTMGFFGVFVSSTIARALTLNFNRDLDVDKQINPISVMVATISIYFLMLTNRIDGGLTIKYLGSSGLFAGMIIALSVPNIYKFFVSRGITIRLPDEVPPNISDTFKSVIPYGAAITVFWIFDMVFRQYVGVNLAEALILWLSPFFQFGDTYLGIAFIFGASAFFWFIGIHGPSMVLPFATPLMVMNLESNQALLAQGLTATHALTKPAMTMVALMGGTGATFMIAIMFAFLSKSKRNRAVGKAAVVPTMFGVNEPILFGGPMVLNPIFFIPFVVTPIVNTIIYKFFVSGLGMGGFIIEVPWTTPAPLGIILGTNLTPLSFLLVPILLVVDFLIYYPFFKSYDNSILEEEALGNFDTGVEDTLEIDMEVDGKERVLILCYGGGTSGLFANSLKKANDQFNQNYVVQAAAYGTHVEIIDNFDLVILAPQVAQNFENLLDLVATKNVQVRKTEGPEYIELSRNPEMAMKYVQNVFAKGNA